MWWGALAASAGGYFLWRLYKGRQSGTLTPDRKAVYDHAMNNVTDSAKLHGLSTVFFGQGLPKEGAALKARANLPNIADRLQRERQIAVKKAFQSTDPEKIIPVAEQLERCGAGRSAACLRDYAQGLQVARAIAPVSIPLPPAQAEKEEPK